MNPQTAANSIYTVPTMKTQQTYVKQLTTLALQLITNEH